MKKRLFIDLDQCGECTRCTVECVAFYRSGMAEHGILKLRELAAFSVVCRRCKEPSCAAACRFDALERQANGVMKRYNLRCVSCKCCAHACPFGTIVPDTVPFYEWRCDYCLSGPGREPACIVGCVRNAVAFREVEENEDDGVYLVNDSLAVRAARWSREAV